MTNKKNALVIKKLDKKTVLSMLNKEINAEYQEVVKSRVKQKMKEIRMLEITLDKAKKELDDLLSGKKKTSEEELLFDVE